MMPRIPAAIGTSRHARGGRRRTRRCTPSGVICTRWSATSVATTADSGTATRTTTTWAVGTARSSSGNRIPSNLTYRAMSGRTS